MVKLIGFILRCAMLHKTLVSAIAAFLLSAGALTAQVSVERNLRIDGQIAPDGHAVELNWFDAQPPRVGSVTVKRRHYGQTGGSTWKPIFDPLGPVMRFTDDTLQSGIAYEYQILRSARDIVDVGYWLSGVNIPAREARGSAYVIVDETIAPDIAPRLTRFMRDLTGDGWHVVRKDAPRWSNKTSIADLTAAQDIKNWLQAHYLADPFGKHAVILVGRLPIVYSGLANPDGHAAQPHATDLFYADMDGQWQANSAGVLQHNALPSDFIEMQIGRIDFAGMAGGKRNQEIHYLNSYFDKNHHWRMGLIGDLRQAYGNGGALLAEHYGLQNIVGPDAFTPGGHHDVGELKPWLWGVDFGDYDATNYVKKYSNKAVFTINFGSGKQKFELPLNAMTALLAQPWYTLAVGWGSRPTWWLHHMALGGTIGDAHMRTVNNGVASTPYRESMDYYPTGNYLWRNPVWVNLLGDPSVRAFPLAPPSDLAATTTDRGVSLFWTAAPDADVIGYKLYRAPSGSMDFAPLAGGDVVQDLEFLDPDTTQNAIYMVRAYGLKDVHAGSFYTLSQGVFATPSASPEAGPALSMTLKTQTGQRIELPDVFNQVTDGKIHAIIEGPASGRLEHSETGWVYTPDDGFEGQVDLRFSVSDAHQTAEGRLHIVVGD